MFEARAGSIGVKAQLVELPDIYMNGLLERMTSSGSCERERDAFVRASEALARCQHDDGHWVFDLEADVTITAEYILLEHFMGRVTPGRQSAMVRHLRRKASADGGGWPLYEGGVFDLSASVKAYLALKLAGESLDASHMVRARRAILSAGGAACANVFTRIQMALFGLVPWRAVPAMPVELVLLPRKAPFSIWAVSYWSRTCIVPLLVIQALRPQARSPSAICLGELFVEPPATVRTWFVEKTGGRRARAFTTLDAFLRRIDPLHSRRLRSKAVAAAVAYVEERLNGSEGLGAIFPAMAYSLMMYHALGRGADDPTIAMIWSALDRLVVDSPDESYCQPCRSPVWDTALAGLAANAAAKVGAPGTEAPDVDAACAWLAERQITDTRGDWAVAADPRLEPGGWAFQYRNDHFPDVDDTSVVAMLLLERDPRGYASAIERARRWILGMQSRNGGWGAFDVDNERGYLNDIPFADHGALLDPSTADVTARCVSFLARLGHAEDRPVIDRAVGFLLREQEADGSWFGRWGCNYIYGTWSVLSALADAGLGSHPSAQRAARWLVSVQRADGGWGEDERSYERGCFVAAGYAQPSQTAWAMLGLMAAGHAAEDAINSGATWLEATCSPDGTWCEVRNAVGFPRVFYLLYKGYAVYFPLLALASHRKSDHRETFEIKTLMVGARTVN